MYVRPEAIETMLKSTGLLKAEHLKAALREQRDTRERLSFIMLRNGYISDENIGEAVASQIGVKLESVGDTKIDLEVAKRAPTAFVHHHRVVPIGVEGDSLTLATDNPFNFLAFGNFKTFLGFNKIKGVLASSEDIDKLLGRYYASREGMPFENIIAGMDKREDKVVLREAAEKKISADEDAPVVKLVSLLIAEAFKKRASDIHIEPLERELRVRYRIDGVLHEASGPPKRLQGSVISRIKIMSGMDIAERRLPQDGRIRIEIEDREIDLRVSTLPAVYGESVVLRILDKSSFLLGLKELGFLEEEEKKFERQIRMPNGILLVTGPTGSGKTTTLYACLNFINKPDRKLITVEDPVEYQISGINQVHVKPQIGLTFASGLRSMLRQAPDVIMVGEIRDFETAEIAVQASLTGHLVFSTLHTNDAPGAITRLIDMGVKPYLVASALQGVLAQRLVRVICHKCKEEYKPSDSELDIIGRNSEKIRNAKFCRGKGCPACANTGYKGRIAIFELLIINDKIRELIFEKVSTSVIKEKAMEMGMATLREDGIKKAISGITTVSEIIRVTQQDIA